MADNFLLRDRVEERNVLELQRPCCLHELRLFGSISQEQNAKPLPVRHLLKPLRGVQDRVQGMGHSVRAHITGDKFPMETIAGDQVRVLGHSLETTEVNAIRYHFNLLWVYASAYQVFLEGLGIGYDAGGPSVEEEFELFQETKQALSAWRRLP